MREQQDFEQFKSTMASVLSDECASRLTLSGYRALCANVREQETFRQLSTWSFLRERSACDDTPSEEQLDKRLETLRKEHLARQKETCQKP